MLYIITDGATFQLLARDDRAEHIGYAAPPVERSASFVIAWEGTREDAYVAIGTPEDACYWATVTEHKPPLR